MNQCGTPDGYAEFKALVREAIDREITRELDCCQSNAVVAAAKYVSVGGGHRWRGLVAIAAGKVFHDEALAINLPGSCAVELVHAASMVLDDLPSMDDADTRRGKPCVHQVFPAWAVDMAPAFLVNLAYAIALRNPLAPPDRRITAAIDLGDAGMKMAAGQTLDLANVAGAPRWDEARLRECYELKSAALYASAARAGAVLCGAGEDAASRMGRAGHWLGMAYQFLDDVADVQGSSRETGKSTGRDAGKTTAVTLFGVDGARKLGREYQDRALGELEPFGSPGDLLREIVRHASWAVE